MPTIEISDDHRDRIEALREELTAAHAGAYASVDAEDALAYLLDVADAVDDPERAADPSALGGDEGGSPTAANSADDDHHPPFDRDDARDRLESRPRRHGDPDAADEMDLYEMAAAFDVTGRSDMTKAELVDAVLDAAESLSTDPFSWAGVDLGIGGADADRDEAADAADADEAEPDAPDGNGTADSPDDETTAEDDETTAEDDETTAEDDETATDAGASQLDAMMSLLDTHDDKWREADGDARYEVELPDGDVETARTKDDVRALLFKNY
ncbi:hypothetical protein [Halorubrum yunnanense]|uniref:Rho termination factor N-terminal domain-containing protein n=1 Tax=Halorubrum yunnanense TaxID=1526162 RepID=A0ABD5YEE5_9EURY|nr:hypothetical protein [Halorubrum yunnanense]